MRNRTFIPLALVVLTTFGVFCTGCCEREAENSAVRSVRILLTNEATTLPCTSNQTTVCVSAKSPNWNALDAELQKLFARVSANNKVEVCYRDISRIPLVIEGDCSVNSNFFKIASVYSLKAGFYSITWKATGIGGEKNFTEVKIPVDEEYPLHQFDCLGNPLPNPIDPDLYFFELWQRGQEDWSLMGTPLTNGRIEGKALEMLENANRKAKRAIIDICADRYLSTQEFLGRFCEITQHLKILCYLDFRIRFLREITEEYRPYLQLAYNVYFPKIYLTEQTKGKKTRLLASFSKNGKPQELEALLELHIRERANQLAIFKSQGRTYVASIFVVYPSPELSWGSLKKAFELMKNLGFSLAWFENDDEDYPLYEFDLASFLKRNQDDDLLYTGEGAPYIIHLKADSIVLDCQFAKPRGRKRDGTIVARKKDPYDVDGVYTSFEEMYRRMKNLSERIAYAEIRF